MADTPDNYLSKRRKIYEAIEKERKSKVLAYITGDRPGVEMSLLSDVIDIFTSHLDAMFHDAKRITLVLYTRGGDPLAAWNLINLMRMFCDDIEVIVITKAHSAGTLMCLGANRVIMTKQATLSPIDPSMEGHHLVPRSPEGFPVPVSVEAIRSYIEFVKSEIDSYGKDGLAKIFIHLSERVHPLVLGAVFRAENQIRYLAEQLLNYQLIDDEPNEERKKRIVEFLVRKSGSHDYTFNRREAKQLGLEIEKPPQEFYDNVIKPLYTNLRDELSLDIPFNRANLIRGKNEYQFNCVRGCVESLNRGSDCRIAKGRIIRLKLKNGEYGDDADNRLDIQFDGWELRQWENPN